MQRMLNSVIGTVLLCLSGCGSEFEADDARQRIVFQVAVDNSTADAEEVLKSVRQTIEARLRAAEVTPEFLVQMSADDRIEVVTSEVTEQQIEQIRDLATRPGTLEFALLANQVDHAGEIAAATSETPAINNDTIAWMPVAEGKEVDTGHLVVTRDSEQREDQEPEFLVIREPPRTRITEEDLLWTMEAVAPNGRPSLDFQLNERGDVLMRQVTTVAAPRPGASHKSRLAIILDGEIHIAPVINEVIAGRGQIAGNFSEDDIRRLAAVLSAGELSASVEFIESQTVESAVE